MADRARIAAKSPAAWIELPDFAAPDGLLSAREAAAALGINERTIRRAIARGDLRAVKHGRAYQITSAALDHYRLQRRPPDLASGKDRAREPPVLLALPTKARTTLAGLPAPLTRFIGRQREIAAISALLGGDDVRLVTLTGPGGVGKTRLAMRVAEEVASRFAAGVAFVSLASVGSPNLVLPAIARALDLRASADRQLKTSLIAALRDRRLLLVLDNFEHLVGAANDIADLLVGCPELAILITSRAPLGLSSEQQVPILPLALPGAGESPALDRLQTYEAIALFIERARHVRPDFVLDAGNAKAVLEICRRLDGLPLALELAAPWLRVLSPGALLARMERRLPLLTGGAPDQPARFRTMRDAIAWSYDLLSDEERRLFRRLAVFVGGFTLDAAEQVARRSQGAQETSSQEEDATPANDPPPSPHHPITPSPSSVTLALLAALIDKSLVQPVDTDGQEPRYEMLETVREFGLEQLLENGEEPATRAAHAAHYLALAEVAGNDKDGIGASEWMPRLAPERPNMRLALDWLDHTGDAEAVLQMTGALWHYWYLFGDLAEGRSRVERALAAAPPGVNPVHQARALRGLGVIARQSADYERSQALLEASLATYRAIGDRAGAAWALNSLGCLFGTLSDERQAEAHLSEALAIFRDIGDAVGTAQLTANLAELAVMAGHYALAIERLEAALELWHALGDRVGEARAQVYLAQMELAQGNPSRAEAALSAGLTAIRDNAYEQILPVALRTAAQLAVRRGNAAAAARWCGAEEALRVALGMELSTARRIIHEPTVTAVRAALGEAAFTTSWSDGRGLSADQVVAEVLAGIVTAAAEPVALDDARLSPREREVFRLLVSGRSDREIADALFITRRTASKHVSAILAKLGVPSRTAAVAFAMQSGHS